MKHRPRMRSHRQRTSGLTSNPHIEEPGSGEFDVPDLTLAAITGALHQVANMDILTTGRLDAEARAEAMVPMLLRALQAR